MSTVTDKQSPTATQRALRAIWVLQGHVVDGMRLKAIASELQTSSPNALRDLEALAGEGIAERIPGREEYWRLTPRIVKLSRATAEEFARHRAAIDQFEQRYK
ncbi:hypothetical protein G3O06_20570 [Burkholderia sp. Ac-20345]|uniref:hypothetical protein n=1 Tax=Burkholderia sp. Ac-20345 TaxID=2703891 RepID=UPI00197C489A|nr:hypothetical protein [Burkholderia sp. Ac-20345]MBN3779934.1 hypothetical protein [Burkholderia sp. Ac-20345]